VSELHKFRDDSNRPVTNNSRAEQTDETFLFEMMIGRQGVGEIEPAHQNEADGVAEGVLLVRASLKQPHASAMVRLSHPNNLEVRVIDDVDQKVECLSGVESTGAR